MRYQRARLHYLVATVHSLLAFSLGSAVLFWGLSPWAWVLVTFAAVVALVVAASTPEA